MPNLWLLFYNCMKVSVITVCYNSEQTIGHTLRCVSEQSYEKIEHILIDGASTDRTMEIVDTVGSHLSKIISEKDLGIYDAMNKGVAHASGGIIGILNSDDMYVSRNVISEVVDAFNGTGADIVFGDLDFVPRADSNKVVRIYRPKKFRPWMLRFGWMPPHPATFIKKSVYDKYGLYALGYKTGADYEMFVRLLLLNKVSYSYLPKTLVHMRMGGATTSGWRSYLTTSIEMVRAVKSNGFYTNIFIILMRLPIKFFELIR